MIEFESVSKTFRDGTTAVDNLNLTVPSGKITVIVGPSGCGKTTTLRMVNRMLEPSKGKITWDDKPIKSRRKTTLRRQMGYVIQSGGLFPHRTVLENIATVPELLRWDKQKSRKRAAELLGSVGLDRKLGNRYPAQLSGGQQQRVGVARALAADPLVLLMDEPFSAVDPVVRAELHEFFLGLQRQLSKTIIMITHDIDEAIKLGDQVAILRVGGKLAQVGSPQRLLDEPADAFVEGFVGRDRGYRSLSFQPASGLALGDVQVVRDAGYTGGSNEPVLVVDGDAQPVGWGDPARPGAMIALGSTFNPETDSLRAALDAALTSPVGLAVAVTGDPRRYAGVVDADMILRQVTQTRAQIAESIAVRAHDESEQPYAAAEQGVDPEQQPYEDPDATSIREVATAEDPDATRVGPAVTDEYAEDPDATRVSGPLPDDTTAENTTAENTTVEAFRGEEPADVAVDQPEERIEPYGAEAPSTEDETVATAYDRQLADDDVLSDQEWQTAADDASEQSAPPEHESEGDALPEAAPDQETPGQDAEAQEAAEPGVAEPGVAEPGVEAPGAAEPEAGEPEVAEETGDEQDTPAGDSFDQEASAADEPQQEALAPDQPADSDDHDREPPR